MNTTIPLALAVALALIAAACGGDDDTAADVSGDALRGSWEASQIYVDGAPVGIVAGSRVTFEVRDDGSVGGTTGCNSYFATAVITPGSISIGDMGMTEMACGEPLGTQEQRVTAILQSADRWAISGETLSIGATDGSGGIDFVRPGPVIDALIPGTLWALDTVVDGDVARTPVSGADAFISIDADANSFSGNTGCNELNGEVIVAPPSISVENIAWTERGCEQSVMDQEVFVLGVLQAATTIAVEGDRLTITDDAGRALVYRAEP